MNIDKQTHIETIALTRKESDHICHLCFANPYFENLLEDKNSYLHPEELKLFQTMKHERRQHSYLLGRFCAKMALAQQSDNQQYKQFHIDSGIFKQPIVRTDQLKNWQVSISHCDELGAAIAFPEEHPIKFSYFLAAMPTKIIHIKH